MIYRCFKNLLIILTFLFCMYVAVRFYNQQFQLNNIQAKWNLETSVPIDFESKPLESILANSFQYLDRGKQAYVFESSDGKYVLKFFDFKCQQSGPLPLLAPISQKKCDKKSKRMMKGFKVAMNYDRENTGLIFVQLAPNPSNNIIVNVKDRFGFNHKIDLGSVPFVLQQKAVPLKKVISKILRKQDVAKAKMHFHKILEMYLNEYQLGVIDLDHNVMYNTGFIGEKPIRLDVGRLQYDKNVKDPSIYNKDLNAVIERISEWLHRHYPLYQEEIVQDLKASFA